MMIKNMNDIEFLKKEIDRLTEENESYCILDSAIKTELIKMVKQNKWHKQSEEPAPENEIVEVYYGNDNSLDIIGSVEGSKVLPDVYWRYIIPPK